MKRIDQQILDINKVICSNIKSNSERGLVSQNIISHLRNFVEHIALKEFAKGEDIDNSYKNIKESIRYIKTRGQLKFLYRFHQLLQITISHYTPDEENSERLMIKYFEYLIRIRDHVQTKFNISLLQNLNSFPLNQDSSLSEYYRKIADQINNGLNSRKKIKYVDRYYIQKIKPFFVDLNVYYEVTFNRAIDNVSKFDRIIAFTNLELSHNYAVKLTVSKSNIEIMGKKMPIQIIDNWEVSIRPCELNNFADIFGTHPKLNTNNKEYHELMKFIKATKNNLVDLILSDDEYYNLVKKIIKERTKVQNFFPILDRCRAICRSESAGTNVVKYLLYKLKNRIIKKQRNNEQCPKLSNLFLLYGCLPFDEMPFNSSLVNHNPKLTHLYDCIEFNGREHELFARYIKNNTEIKGMLYTPISEVKHFKDINALVSKHNQLLYSKHKHRSIEQYKNHFYIKGYEFAAVEIVKKLVDFSSVGLKNYKNSITAWLQSGISNVDCEEKKKSLTSLFEDSKVALIYGAAGTGKSTMINHIANFFKNEKKLFMANTNPAVDNLNRRVSAPDCEFKTIAKFLSNYNNKTDYNIVFIDECSTVSNSMMLKILNKGTFQLLILVGDIYQIESIRFGNWFSIVRSFINEKSIFELTKPYRSNNEDLLTYWSRVRKIEDNIMELSTKRNYSVTLDDSIFENHKDDEIILCLNYDGLYGINNINRFLQSSNPHESIEWGVEIYKKNDPILFNENQRFGSLLYNNLKGRILDIVLIENEIQFDIEIDTVLNELDVIFEDLELLDCDKSDKSVIRFTVKKYGSTDDDETSSDSVVPFQVAYAVSIHKAQGLEYNSVKVVINNEVEELITHNIFYTAITRARNELKIYWSPESENKIIKSLTTRFNKLDISLLKSKNILN